MTQPAQGGGQQQPQQQQPGTEQQGTGGQQGQGQQGTTQEQGGTPALSGLLDEQAQQGGGDGGQQGGEQQQGGTGQSGSGQQQQTSGQPATADEIARIVESTVDRRINAVLREVRGQGGSGQQGQQQGGQQGGSAESGQGQQSQGQASAPAGPTAADLREARLVYREYVADEVQFLGTVEREHASTLAGALIHDRLSRGDDHETAGREAAKQVASTVKSLRQHYEQQTIAALRRRGLLPDDGRGSGPAPTAGPQTPGDTSSFAAGATKAATMFADRMPAAAGAQQ